jgi:hypothetical protein
MRTQFRKLNHDWNAEPNAPHPTVKVHGNSVSLEFVANSSQFLRFSDGQRLRLRFTQARRYRLGATNDEGWYRGECRFSRTAPAWGEFYQVSGDLVMNRCPSDWHIVGSCPASHHFLFYLRDDTFECEADDWKLEE